MDMGDGPGHKLFRLSGLCGILTPVVAFTAIAASIASSPWFDWGRNALSDLGASGSPVAPLFNAGLVTSGLLATVFSYGLTRYVADKRGRAGASLILAASVALALIGVFPEDMWPLHFAVSAAFFVLAPLGFLVLAISRLLRPEKVPRALGALMLLSALASGATWVFWALSGRTVGIAVPEAISAAFVAAWIIALGSRMARSAVI